MRYYVNKFNGRVADMLQIQKHDKIVLQTNEAFDIYSDEDIKKVWDRIKNVEQSSIVIYGFYNRASGQERGDFWSEALLSKTFEEFKTDLRGLIKYAYL